MKPENIRFFASQAAFRKWLAANHDKAPFQWVGFWKKSAGRSGLTYDEAVLEALCFGWIDGQTNRVDDLSVTVRFSPRRSSSHWSELNIARVKELTRSGRMHPAGLKAFEARHESEHGGYSYESRPGDLPDELAAVFRTDEAAWGFWMRQPPGYRKAMTWYVVSAKRDDTRLRRLQALINESKAGRRVDLLNTPKLKSPKASG